MEDARIYISGRPRIVNAPQFVWASEEHPEIKQNCTCVECGNRAFLNDVKGAKGIKLVGAELAEHSKRRRYSPGFSHYKGNAGKYCPLYSDDPRFIRLRKNNTFDALEKERNLEALNKPAIRETVVEVQRYLLKQLTGEKNISEDNQETIAKIEKRVSSMIGIADHPWSFIYISALLVGSRKKAFDGQDVRLEYQGMGEQKLPVVGLDGQERFLCIPEKLQLCRSRKHGKKACTSL